MYVCEFTESAMYKNIKYVNFDIIHLIFIIWGYYFSPSPCAVYGITANAMASKTKFILEVVVVGSIILCKR